MEIMGIDVTLYALIALAAALVIAVCALILVLVQFSKLKKQTERLSTFMAGAEDMNIEESLNDKFARLSAVEEKQKTADEDIGKIYKTLEGTYQKMGIVKYNAYSENGGRLSFSLALLDQGNNGFVMNVMTGTDGSYGYIKAIVGGESKIKLGKEEARALEKAMSR